MKKISIWKRIAIRIVLWFGNISLDIGKIQSLDTDKDNNISIKEILAPFLYKDVEIHYNLFVKKPRKSVKRIIDVVGSWKFPIDRILSIDKNKDNKISLKELWFFIINK